MKYRECGDRFYYFNTSCYDNTKNSSIYNYSFLSTVSENKKQLACKEIEGEYIYKDPQ